MKAIPLLCGLLALLASCAKPPVPQSQQITRLEQQIAALQAANQVLAARLDWTQARLYRAETNLGALYVSVVQLNGHAIAQALAPESDPAYWQGAWVGSAEASPAVLTNDLATRLPARWALHREAY